MSTISLEQHNLNTTLEPVIQTIQAHPIFTVIKTVEDLKRFSEIHVFAVWDFMCLSKALQRELISPYLLWSPPDNHLGCRLLHEIVMKEESDELKEGHYLSHFEWYLNAMTQCGARTQTINQWLKLIQRQRPLETIFAQLPLSAKAVMFMRTTFEIIQKPVHVIANAFAYRIEIRNHIFFSILQQLKIISYSKQCSLFIDYFQRHIETEENKHTQQAKTLVKNLCDNDSKKWLEADQGAMLILNSQIDLLDGIYKYIITGKLDLYKIRSHTLHLLNLN